LGPENTLIRSRIHGIITGVKQFRTMPLYTMQ
jgi:hypothetical protein